jgi:Lon protease-like protein
MGRRLEELPLFPLNVVLFPHAQLMLHVFEERYIEMMSHCIQNDAPFGIVLIRSGEEVGDTAEPYLVGTVARITRTHTYHDGRLDIEVSGERRFRVRELDDALPYLVGKVEPLVEEEMEETPRAVNIISKAREAGAEYIEKCLTGADFRVASIKLPDDPVVLGFVLGGLLNIPNLEKQHLLETTDTLERLRTLIPVLENQAEAMEQAPAPTLARLSGQEAIQRLTSN